MIWFWFGILFISFGLEIITRKMLFIPFCVASLTIIIFELFSIDLVIQVIVFIVLSVILLLIRSLLHNRIFSFIKNIPLEETVGQKCTVVEEVDNFRGCGIVRVGNQLWAARAAFDEDAFKIGESLSVVAIEGVKLICRKV